MKRVKWGLSQFCSKALVWLNISIQFSYPLIYTLTPSVAIAVGVNENKISVTRAYTLGEGETASSVAKKYNITPNALRQLNQFRTFSHGFDKVQPGDEIDVPVPSQTNNAQIVAAEDLTMQERQQRLTSMASQTGNFLKNHPNRDVAEDQARGLVSGEAGEQIQHWLSHFGTARVSLDSDKNFSLKNSQFDLLIPLYDQRNNVFFTQGSLHRKDNRSQSNLGLGIRHFSQDYMLGGNVFADYDLSRNHARVGAGVEYWRDYLKVGANSYIRLTNWKESTDLKGYEERPANGWDIRSEAWLPAYPQLGAKLAYEKYYGNEVALFGKDNRQRNPQALTAGINYTPVPLLTLNIDQQLGAAGKSDTRFGASVSYQIGVPWQRQFDPTGVEVLRKLTGSRYDLVERNNNIVLEYRKKSIIRLHAVDLITGSAGERKSLGVSVKSTYGVSRIDWSAPALIAAGGGIVQSGKDDYEVILPPYHYSTESLNNYTVTGVAIDTKGNRSNQTLTQVAVKMPELNISNSMLSPDKSVLPADGKSTQVLKLELRDNQNNPVDLPATDISIDKGTLKSASVSNASKSNAGTYLITVTAGTETETVIVKPIAHGVTLSAAEVSIRRTMPAVATSSISTDKVSYEAGDAMVVTAILKDADGNALLDAASLLSGSTVTVGGGEDQSKTVWSSKGDGSYTATYTAMHPGANQLATMRFTGWSSEVSSAPYSIIAAPPAAGKSNINVDKVTYSVGDDMTVTVLLRDATGHPVIGKAALLTGVTVLVANAVKKTGANWTDNGNGSYTSLYTANSPGTSLTAKLNLDGWAVTVSSGAYEVKRIPPERAHSSIQLDKATYRLGDDIQVTVTLHSANDISLPGNADLLDAAVTVPFNNTHKPGATWSDNGDGTYTTTYVASTVVSHLTAKLNVGWAHPVTSGLFEVVDNPAITLSVPGGFTETANKGFPTSAFKGATFSLVVLRGDVSNYDWDSGSNSSWVSVDAEGVVKFIGEGTGNEVTITGTPKSGSGVTLPLTYKFKLKQWYEFEPDFGALVAISDKRCTDKGMDIPEMAKVFAHNKTWRGTGYLRSEWGQLTSTNYPGNVFRPHYWAKESGLPASGAPTRLTFFSTSPQESYGIVDSDIDYTACVKNF